VAEREAKREERSYSQHIYVIQKIGDLESPYFQKI
jgi:hypothetical protein